MMWPVHIQTCQCWGVQQCAFSQKGQKELSETSQGTAQRVSVQ